MIMDFLLGLCIQAKLELDPFTTLGLIVRFSLGKEHTRDAACCNQGKCYMGSTP